MSSIPAVASAPVCPLDSIDPERDVALGGKARGLARLVRAGARVPPGFAIAAAQEPPEAWPAERRQAVREAAAVLLARGPVAVRSSGLVEDGEARSFAGLFETFLGVDSPDGVLEAIGRCLASGRSERVRSLAPDGSATGVVVQAMVAARCAGVCFTQDPTGVDRAVVVEAVAGTGDALVSGREQPERWRVHRTGHGTLEARPATPGRVLDAALASRIAQEAGALEKALGRPLDLEWALDGTNTLFWLQARPITAAREPPTWDVQRYQEGVDDGPVTLWANWNVRETMPDALHPLTWSVWRDHVLPALMETLMVLRPGAARRLHLVPFDLVNGRIYWNMNACLGPGAGWFMFAVIRAVDPEAGQVIRRLYEQGAFRARRLPAGWGRDVAVSILRWPLAIARSLVLLSPRACLRTLERACAAVRDHAPPESLSDEALGAELSPTHRPEFPRMLRGIHMEGVAMAVWSLAARAFARWPEAQGLLGAGLADNPTTAISVDLDRLAELGRPLGAELTRPRGVEELLAALEATPAGRAWAAAFRDYVRRHGHRGPKEFDLAQPRWDDDPSMVLDLVRLALARPPGESTGARLERLHAQREAALARAVAQAPFWKRPWLRFLARAVERWMPLREAPKHAFMVAFARARRLALEAGRRLASRGALASADEAFLLEVRELAALLRARRPEPFPRERLEERRRAVARHQAQPAPDFVRSDGVPVEPPRHDAPPPGVLRGLGVSSGRASGRVRILEAPDPKALSGGDVLVVRFADPGWTPLFPRCAAVVMEVGGLMCHAAVIARELDVPAVFGVRGARQALRDGDLVEVDGVAGTVRRVDEPAPLAA